MAIKLALNSETILNKVFKGVPRGYDPYDVDKFLDKVLEDYRTIEANYIMSKKEIDGLNQKIFDLNQQIKNLEIELGRYKSKFDNIKPDDNVNNDNLDLLKKINAYERFLWNNGFNPNNIK